MTSPVDLEKAEDSRPLLVEVSSDDSISASDVPEVDSERRTLFILVYALCVLFFLHTLSRFEMSHWPSWGQIGEEKAYDSSIQLGCLDNLDLTVTATPWSTGGHVYHAHTSIALPVSSEELSFDAFGDLSYGTFQISQSLEAGSQAIVDVTVRYHRPEVLDNVTMCRLHPSEGKWGLGVFTPKWFAAEAKHKVQVDINVRLPASPDPRKPLTVKGLRTHLPQHTHVIHDLSQSVHFGKVDLVSDNGAFTAEGLQADTINVDSRSGPITGTYNATKMLALNTNDAPIAVRANLLGGHNRSVALFLITSNSFIDSQIGLYSNASDFMGGAFTVSARTYNSPLKLAFVDAPVNSFLSAAAGTSNAPAQVRLHETYEGSLMLRGSTFFPPAVEWRKGVEDPTGRERERTVKVNATEDSVVTGEVFWDAKKDAKKKGCMLWFEPSNAPLRLIL